MPQGQVLQIGHAEGEIPRGARLVEVPVPEGTPWLARVLYGKDRKWLAQLPDGSVRDVDQPVHLRSGEVEVTLALARRVPLKRLELPSIQGSLAWLSMVVMATLVTVQVAWLRENACALAVGFLPRVSEVGGPLLWLTLPVAGFAVAVAALVIANDWRSVVPALLAPVFGVILPLGWQLAGLHLASGEQFLEGPLSACIAKPDASGSGVSAEYLARLLRKDYAGEDQGVLAKPEDRPDAQRKTDKHVFMPAGAPGPATKMGGAADKTLRPVRTLVVEPEPEVPKQRHGADEPKPPGPTPAHTAKADEAAAAGKERGVEADATSEADDPAEPPSEDVEGWGIPGWYDEKDIAVENFEIEQMLRYANRILRIDPDDIDALGLLSYYQYLAQDYQGALKTYDHILALDPEDAAAYNNKALVYKRQGEYRKEEGLYRKALSLEPMDETALNNLAVNLAHQGRFDEALQIMKDLETIDPDDPYADLHRAKIQAQMGHDEEALRYLDQALAGMAKLDTLHHIEFRQDIRLDPAFAKLRETAKFKQILIHYYGKDTPLEER